MSKHRGKTASEWARLIRAWKRDGRTAAEFALEHDVSARALTWWRTHLAREATSRGRAHEESLELLPVVVDAPAAPSSDARWEIVIPGGIVIRVLATLSSAEVETLMRALGAAP